MLRKKTVSIIFFLLTSCLLVAQVSPDSLVIDYQNPRQYQIEAIKITGIQFLDTMVVKSMCGLKEGETITIPSNEITKIIKKFWDQGLFSDVRISASHIHDGKLTIDIYLSNQQTGSQ